MTFYSFNDSYENLLFYTILKQSLVLKASLWLYVILTRAKLKGIYYFIIQFDKKAKE